LNTEYKACEIIKIDPCNFDSSGAFPIFKIYFELGRATIKSVSQQQIKAIMTFLKQNNKLSLQIGDRCKGIRNSNSSYSLAQNRTNKVVKTLVNIGIQIEILEQKGYHEEQTVSAILMLYLSALEQRE
jgi:outer membrane protein OmpA-like peptidoglycan-associated protein